MLIGRAISALFDTGTILLTAWLGLRLTQDDLPGRPHAWNVALFVGSLVVFTPLQLQLSHFYAVDTMLVFFVILTILACVILVDTDAPMRWALVAGLGYGLALGTKVSAAPLAVPLLVAIGLRWYKKRSFLSTICPLVLAITISLVVFLLVEPYALLDFNNFRSLTSQEGDIARGALDVPYTRQFAGTIPDLYEGQNMILWGMGVTLGCSAVVALLWFIWRALRRDVGSWLVVLSWIFVYSAIVGSFYTKYMRYMLPVYPLLTLMAAVGVLALVRGLLTSKQGFLRRQNRVFPLLLQYPQTDRRERENPMLPPMPPDVGHSNGIMLNMSSGFALAASLLVIVLGGTIFQGLALLNVYSQPICVSGFALDVSSSTSWQCTDL